MLSGINFADVELEKLLPNVFTISFSDRFFLLEIPTQKSEKGEFWVRLGRPIGFNCSNWNGSNFWKVIVRIERYVQKLPLTLVLIKTNVRLSNCVMITFARPFLLMLPRRKEKVRVPCQWTTIACCYHCLNFFTDSSLRIGKWEVSTRKTSRAKSELVLLVVVPASQ